MSTTRAAPRECEEACLFVNLCQRRRASNAAFLRDVALLPDARDVEVGGGGGADPPLGFPAQDLSKNGPGRMQGTQMG